MEAVKAFIDQLMREDEKFQEISIKKILSLLSKVMNCADLSVYKKQVITYIQDRNGKNESQVVLQIILTISQG